MELPLNFYPAHKLNKMLRQKQVSASEIVDAVICAIDKAEARMHAYLRVESKEMAQAAAGFDSKSDALAKNGSISDFCAIPIAIKDNICTKGITTTCASKILSNYIPVYDATVIKRLKAAGYILSGKANMDEFAMGSSNENSYFGPVKNPWDLERVPGGSSGGPAASVAAGTAICSLGSDTGGSIRQPASLCGVVGLKPTYGLVSRYGLIAFASSLDQIGPFTRDVEDSARLLNVICGWDENDSTSIGSAEAGSQDYTKYLGCSIKGLKIGVPKELMVKEVDGEVRQKVNEALALAESAGAIVEEISLPSLEYALSVYYIIAPSEASSNLSRFDGVRYGYRNRDAATLRQMYKKSRAQGFGPEVKRRIMIGTYSLSAGYYDAYYEKAQRVRTLIINDFNNAFKKYDVLISPTSPSTAFRIGEKAGDPLKMYMSDICTIPVNLAGIPAISIPAGLSSEGLPVGLQIIADTLREDNIFRMAHALEEAIGFDSHPMYLYK